LSDERRNPKPLSDTSRYPEPVSGTSIWGRFRFCRRLEEFLLLELFRLELFLLDEPFFGLLLSLKLLTP